MTSPFMTAALPPLVITAIAGTGLMAGLLFAFSTVVVRALRQLPDEVGMLAMQRINVLIINPLFALVFAGTTLLSLGIGVASALSLSAPGAPWWLAGAAAYLVGPFGVTVVCNVPLNDTLALARSERANSVWPAYADRWLMWNHVRTVLALVSLILLATGLSAAADPAP